MSDELTPELVRLIQMTESTLYYVAKLDLTREQALDFKQRISRPLGILNSRHGFMSDKIAKNMVRNNSVAKSDIKD